MKQVEKLVEMFIGEKESEWSPSTRRSEASRLNSLIPFIDGKPDTLWRELHRREMGAYTIRTVFVRVVTFYQWALDRGHAKGPNTYRLFKESKSRFFKKAYQVKLPEMTYTEAMEKIALIKDDALRGKAVELLTGGLRWTESTTLADGKVVGKGGEERKVYPALSTAPAYEQTYQTFRRTLAAVTGLKPHDLRKIFASSVGREGLTEADMLKLMGWKSIATAKSYLAPMRDEELAEKVMAMRKKGA